MTLWIPHTAWTPPFVLTAGQPKPLRPTYTFTHDRERIRIRRSWWHAQCVRLIEYLFGVDFRWFWALEVLHVDYTDPDGCTVEYRRRSIVIPWRYGSLVYKGDANTDPDRGIIPGARWLAGHEPGP